MWIKREVSHEGCQQGIHTKRHMEKKEMQRPCIGSVMDVDLLKSVLISSIQSFLISMELYVLSTHRWYVHEPSSSAAPFQKMLLV